MDAFLSGFTGELTKLGSVKDHEKEMKKALNQAKKSTVYTESDGDSLGMRSLKTGRNYMAAALLGAMATPAASLIGKGVARHFHNTGVKGALKAAKGKKAKKALKKQLEHGPILGSGIPKPKAGKVPMMTTSDAIGQVARGGVYGSVLQMLKDRYVDKPSSK